MSRISAGLTLTLLLVALFVPLGPTASQTDDAPLHTAPWSEGPLSELDVPEAQGRNLRVHLSVAIPESLSGMRDLPVTYTLDVAQALRDAGYPSRANGQLDPFRLNMDSFSLVEVDPDELSPVHPVGENGARLEALLVFPGSFTDTRSFDARTNPTVTLQWVLDGPSHTQRDYLLYFDTEHNGPKTPVGAPQEALGAVASAVGPGRGDRLFVPWHTADAVRNAPQDPRSIRVTNLQDSQVEVGVWCYERSRLRDDPVATTNLQNFGQTWDFRIADLGGKATQCSEGAAMVRSDGGLVLAEITSRVFSTSYQTGTSRLFLPSVDGGYTGTSFTGTSDAATDWLVFCPPPPVNDQDCTVTSSAGGPFTIRQGDRRSFSMGAGQASVTATQGMVSVLRIPSSASSATQGQLPLTLWPAMDGPLSASLFMGHAFSRHQDHGNKDKLLLMPHDPNTVLQVNNMEGAGSRIASALKVGGPGLYTERSGAWGANWDRGWERTHQDGATRIQTQAGGPLTVASGQATSGFSALVPLQSPNGGLRYEFHLPHLDATGEIFGRLVLFNLHDGTDVVASGVRPDGSTDCCIVQEALEAGQTVDLVDQPGWWTVEATRPVVMAWLHRGQDPFSAFAPGTTTDLLDVQVEGAQFAGYLVGMHVDDGFRSVRPGSSVDFTARIDNLARSVTGESLPDRVQLRARAPSGWPTPDVIPSTLDFAAGDGPREVQVTVRVPGSVDVSEGGATVTLTAQSANQPGLQVASSLAVNYRVQRGVHVTADGQPSEATKEVTPGEPATYNVRLMNTGSVTDSFHLVHSVDGNGWSNEVLCLETEDTVSEGECFQDHMNTTTELAPQETVDYLFTVTPSASAAGRFVTLLAAESRSDPSVRSTIRLVSTLQVDRDLTFHVEETTRVVDPGETTTFHVVIRNAADRDEELDLTVSPLTPESWSEPEIEVLLADASRRTTLEALEHVVPVPQTNEVEMWITQTVPPDAPPRILGVDQLIAEPRSTTEGRPHTIDLRVVVAEVRGFEIDIEKSVRSAAPGSALEIQTTYRSIGNGVQHLEVTPESPPGTGWVFLDAEGQSPPWNLTLPPRESATLTVTSTVPRDAPALPDGIPLEFRSTVDGYPPLPAQFRLNVAPEPRVSLDPHTLRLDPGRTTQIQVPVANSGNVPLTLDASWQDFPPEYEIEQRSFDLDVGDTTTISFNVTVPATVLPLEEVRLSLVDTDAGHQDTTQWPVALGRPRLESRLLEIRTLETGARVVEIELTNTGTTPAYDVRAEVRDAGRLVDTADLNVVRPEEQRLLNLILPPDAKQPSINIYSADDPDGTVLEGLTTLQDERNVPMAGALWSVMFLITILGVTRAFYSSRAGQPENERNNSFIRRRF